MSIITLQKTPISKASSLTTTSTTYGTVASWTVSTGKKGALAEVALTSDTPSKTQWRLTIGGVEKWTGLVVLAALNIPFDDLDLPAAAVVLLEAASTDGTSVICNGSISGEEE